MNQASTVDPEVARTIASLLQTPAALDRRTGERLAFPSQELVAYFVAGESPTNDDFNVVELSDLSEDGFSFYWPTVPSSDMVIVGLKVQGELAYLLAEVRSCIAIAGVASGKYRVGCRFVKRLDSLADAKLAQDA